LGLARLSVTNSVITDCTDQQLALVAESLLHGGDLGENLAIYMRKTAPVAVESHRTTMFEFRRRREMVPPASCCPAPGRAWAVLASIRH